MLKWVSAIGSLGTLIACKGLLVFFSVMSAFGVSMTLDGGTWVKLILVFVSLALVGFVVNFRRHGNLLAILLAVVGAGAIYYAYLVQFNRPIETAGIVVLVIAAGVDIWAMRKQVVA
jgi:MerC mercury resistance protein